MDAAFIWNLSKLGRIGSRRLQFDDDFADRLNYQYTSVLLFLFIGLIGVRQYVGKPIQCWIPQEFTRGWEEYAENYCWVANTYFAPVENRLPPVPDRRELLLVYYQWAPIVMAAQALLFYLPCLTWRLGMAHSGFNLHRVLQMAAEANEMNPEATEKTVKLLSHYMQNCIQRQRMYKICSEAKRVGVYNRLENDKYVGGNRELKRTWAQSYTFNSTANGKIDSKHNLNEGSNLCADKQEVTDECQLGRKLQESMNKSEGDLTKHDLIDPTLVSEHKCSMLNQNSETSMTSSNSIATAELLAKGRGRKPAPPPPPINGNNSGCNDGAENRIQNLDPALETGQTKPVEQMSGQKREHLESQNHSHESRLKQPSDKSKQLKIDATNKTKPCSPVLRSCCIESMCGKDKGNFLVTLYMLVKLGYLSNVIGQIYLMQSFIGTKYTLYGAQVLIDLIRGQEWHHSGHFPRVTFCDLEAKKLGKNHVYTLQCVLPLNMFLEKIYIFLWFWHVVIAFITFISLMIWVYRLYWPASRFKLIDSYLKMLGIIPLQSDAKYQKVVDEFINIYLGLDGYFVIRLITANCGALLASELTAEMWLSFQGLSKTKTFGNARSCSQCICLTCDHKVKVPSKSGAEIDSDVEAVCEHALNSYENRRNVIQPNLMSHGSMHPYFWMPTRKKHADVAGHIRRSDKSYHRSRLTDGWRLDAIEQHVQIPETQPANRNFGSFESSQQPSISSTQVAPTSFQHRRNSMRPSSGRMNNLQDDIV